MPEAVKENCPVDSFEGAGDGGVERKGKEKNFREAERVRLFVAVTFPESVRKLLINTMHELKSKGVSGNYSAVQNLHMTLVFIGEVPSSEPVKRAMEAVPFSPFRLTLTEMGSFGDILWAGLKSGQKLKEFNQGLRKKLDEAGIPYDRKDLVPHITLVKKASRSCPPEVKLPRTELMVEKISLMKSEQKDGRTVYTEIFSVR